MIRVLIADDHTVLRHGLRMILEEAEGITVVGEAADGAEAVAQVQALQPDVVLMDVNMPLMDGVEATGRIRAAQPQVRVLMLTISDRDQDLLAAVRAGARGYLLKSAESKEVLDAIRRVVVGEAILPPALTARLLDELAAPTPAPPALTPRELDVLNLITEGLANKEIAAQLHISENTVKTHVRHILEKLGLRSRAEAAVYAVREGLTARRR